MNSAVVAQRLVSASLETAFAAIVVLALTALLTRRAPRAAAVLWLAVLLKPLLTLAGVSIIPVRLPAIVAPVHAGTARNIELTEIRRGTVASTSQRAIRDADPASWIVAIWIAGAGLALTRTFRDRLRLRSMIRGSHLPSAALALRYQTMTAAMHNVPLLRICDTLDGPAIAGLMRPVILLPSWMELRGDAAQLEWTLRHELRHAIARDTVGIAVREVAHVAFWFHPLIWIAGKKWEAATELACDRDVVASDAEAVDYAEALYTILVEVHQGPRVRLATGLFATRSKMGARIAALLETPHRRRGGKMFLVAAAMAGLAVVLTGSAPAASTHHHRGHLEEVDDNVSSTMEWDGAFDFAPLTSRIDRISDGGWAHFRETANGITRDLRLEGTASSIHRSWSVNGRTVAVDRDAESFERTMTARMLAAMRGRGRTH